MNTFKRLKLAWKNKWNLSQTSWSKNVSIITLYLFLYHEIVPIKSKLKNNKLSRKIENDDPIISDNDTNPNTNLMGWAMQVGRSRVLPASNQVTNCINLRQAIKGLLSPPFKHWLNPLGKL